MTTRSKKRRMTKKVCWNNPIAVIYHVDKYHHGLDIDADNKTTTNRI